MPVTFYIYLAIALLLLCFPRGWMRFGKRVSPKPPRKINESKVERDPYDRSPKPLQEAVKSRNWVDFFRAAAGGYAVMLVAQQWSADPDSAPTGWVLTSVAGVLVIGTIVQMVRLEGRLGLYELLPVDRTLQALILERPSIDALRQFAASTGMPSLYHAGREKVLAGLTSTEELSRVVYID